MSWLSAIETEQGVSEVMNGMADTISLARMTAEDKVVLRIELELEHVPEVEASAWLSGEQEVAVDVYTKSWQGFRMLLYTLPNSFGRLSDGHGWSTSLPFLETEYNFVSLQALLFGQQMGNYLLSAIEEKIWKGKYIDVLSLLYRNIERKDKGKEVDRDKEKLWRWKVERTWANGDFLFMQKYCSGCRCELYPYSAHWSVL